MQGAGNGAVPVKTRTTVVKHRSVDLDLHMQDEGRNNALSQRFGRLSAITRSVRRKIDSVRSSARRMGGRKSKLQSQRSHVQDQDTHPDSTIVGTDSTTNDVQLFRLLETSPHNDFDAPIRGKLIQCPISDAPKYIALSTAHSNAAADCHVDLGQTAPTRNIARHLYKALQRLRHSSNEVHVWVDTLCIDQEDDLERAAQIDLMPDIYTQAETVRIWLGEEHISTHDGNTATSDEAIFPSLARQRDPWWKQLWILQHCAYARACPVVMIGSLSIPLDDLITRWEAVTDSFKQRASLSEESSSDTTSYHQMRDSLSYLHTPLELWRARNQGHDVRAPLLERLRESYRRRYSDPHDMIYAILNLVDEKEARQFRADYRIPVQDVWAKAMELCRQSPLWQRGIDDYFFDPAVLESREIIKTRPLTPCGAAIITEAHNGNTEILPCLLEMRTLSDFKLADDSKEFRNSKESRIKDGLDVKDSMPNPSLLTKDALEIMLRDPAARTRLLLLNEHLYRQSHQQLCGLFKLAVINALPQTLTALIKAVKQVSSTLCFTAWLEALITSDAALHPSGLDTIKAIITIPDSSFHRKSSKKSHSTPAIDTKWLELTMNRATRLGKIDIVRLMLAHATCFENYHYLPNNAFGYAVGRGNVPIAECLLDFIIARTRGIRYRSLENAVDDAFHQGHTDMILWLSQRIATLDEEVYVPDQLLGALAVRRNVPDQFLARATKLRQGEIISPMLKMCREVHVRFTTDESDLPEETTALRKRLGKLARTGTWPEITAEIHGKESELKAYEFYWEAIETAITSERWTIAEALLPETWTPRDNTQQPLFKPPQDLEDPSRFWEKLQYRGRQHQSGFVAASGGLGLAAESQNVVVDEVRENVGGASSSCKHVVSKEYSAFVYQPTSPGQIRVLELLPGQYGDRLEGRLRHVDVGSDPVQGTAEAPGSNLDAISATDGALPILAETSQPVPYTALSYCWGSSGFTHEVILSGHLAKITLEVDSMLRRLREPHRSITLWLDQVCIDQNSNDDKAIQVQLMGTIYTKATNTIIWLGEESSNGAFWALQLLSESLMGIKDYLLEEDLERVRSTVVGEDVSFSTIEKLFQRPWFQRTWVVQEAVLSEYPYFMAKDEIISWEDFAGYCVGLKELELFRPRHDTGDDGRRGHGEVVVSGAEILADIYLLRSKRDTIKTGFLTWLVDTRYAQAKYGADKIYGLLGVCPIAVYPSYDEKSEWQVYHEVTTMLIRQAFVKNPRDAADLIYALFSCVDHRSGIGLAPSWIADWSQPRQTTALASRISDDSFYRAGIGAEPSDITLSADGRVITTTVRVVSTVREISATTDNAELSYKDPTQSNQSLQICIDFIKNSTQPAAQDLPFETFCATLVAGKDSRGFSPHKPGFTELISLLCDATTSRSPSLPNQTYTKRQKTGRFDIANLARRQPGRLFQNLWRAYRNALQARRLCWTQDGQLGLVPRFTSVGDQIVILPGATVPFVIREDEKGRFELIGECYVHDVMDGEYMKTPGLLRMIEIV